jgi:hypothetical protein
MGGFDAMLKMSFTVHFEIYWLPQYNAKKRNNSDFVSRKGCWQAAFGHWFIGFAETEYT